VRKHARQFTGGLFGLVILVLLDHPSSASPMFTGLGDLLGGSFQSRSLGVSGDGSVVVGRGFSGSNGNEAFRWTSAGGMVGLGDLEGASFSSVASGASADGSVVVGEGFSASGNEAFRWTAGGGMVGLGDLVGGTWVLPLFHGQFDLG
jgi:probable HAF family extracellular repeat protein